MAQPKKSNSNDNSAPLILMAAGLVLIIIVLIWQLYKSQSNNYNHSMLLPTATSEIPYPEVTRVSLKDAHIAFDKKTAVFVDVRSASTYDQGHIPGAINLPLDQLEASISQLSPKSWIIPYCT